jgi:DNA-binding NtrC family response regulator
VRKRAILCVDDEVIILLSLMQELRMAFGPRFVYEQAMSAEGAFRIMDELQAEGVRVVLIITDWLMPGMKGDEFLEIASRRYPHIKAVMITGQADEQAITRVRGISSVLSVLKKPWDAAELAGLVRLCDGEAGGELSADERA